MRNMVESFKSICLYIMQSTAILPYLSILSSDFNHWYLIVHSQFFLNSSTCIWVCADWNYTRITGEWFRTWSIYLVPVTFDYFLFQIIFSFCKPTNKLGIKSLYYTCMMLWAHILIDFEAQSTYFDYFFFPGRGKVEEYPPYSLLIMEK